MYDKNKVNRKVTGKELHSILFISFGRMESAYRAWLKSRKEGLVSQHLDKLNRELLMALRTAKWQVRYFFVFVSFVDFVKYSTW